MFAGILVITGIIFLTKGKSGIYKTVMKAEFSVPVRNMDIIYGADSAPLTIVMYSRYNCVFCRKFFSESFPLLKSEYIDPGKARLIVKLVEFSNDADVLNSLKTVVCIHKYGKFQKLNELLLSDPQVVYTKEFREVTDGFIDRDSNIAECMLGGESDAYLATNKQEFMRLKLTGTPTFVINNHIYKGYKAYPDFKKVVEKEWKEALP